MLEALSAKSSSNKVDRSTEIAKLNGPSLFSELRTFTDTALRRAITHKVHYHKMKEYSKDRAYRATIAYHLVEEVHPMFRNGFANVLEQSKLGDVKVAQFNRINQNLHHHHGSEDEWWFPELRKVHPEIASEVDILESDHASLVQMEESIQQGSYESLVEFVAFLNDHLNREELLTVPYLMDGSSSL